MVNAVSANNPFDEPGRAGMAHREGGSDSATREAEQRRKTIRLVLIGLIAGTSLGYVAVSMRNGDLSWLKNLGSGSASAPATAAVP